MFYATATIKDYGPYRKETATETEAREVLDALRAKFGDRVLIAKVEGEAAFRERLARRPTYDEFTG